MSNLPATFVICHIRKYQKYKDRRPLWFSMYTDQRDVLDQRAASLGIPLVTDEEYGQITCIYALATRYDDPKEMPDGPALPYDASWIKLKAGLNAEPDLERLVSLCVISCNISVTGMGEPVPHMQRQKHTKSSCHNSVATEAIELAELLGTLMRDNDPKAKINTNKWAVDIDKIHRLDGRSFEEIEVVVRWCQLDPFWHKNILSGQKLRKQFNQLILKSGKQAKATREADWING